MNKKIQNILVTGGAGFIGSSLCEKLIRQGYSVSIVDNFCDYYDPAYKEQNVEYVRKAAEELSPDGKSLKVYRADIRSFDDVKKIFDENEFDAVIHLAACAGVRPSIENPLLYSEVNIGGTLNILENIRSHGVKNFIFASSSSVYGNNRTVPFKETDVVDFPISPYAATKKSGELMCHTYHHLYDINTICLRFFTVYGPRQRPDLAIYKFTKLINEGKAIPVFGDGSSRRDYTYIDDIVNGVTAAVKLEEDTASPLYEIINLGESNTITLHRMIGAIEKSLGKKAVIKRLPMQPGDVDATYADVGKAKAMLGYEPSTRFEEGIDAFVAWFLKYRI